MARSTLASLNTRIAALEARLAVATAVYRDQKSHIADLEAALNTRGVKPAVVPAAPAAPKHFMKGGVEYVRVPVGFNTWAIRPVHAEAA